MLPDASHCLGTRRDGTPCTATVLLSDGYCFAHSPANQAARAEARRRGGRGKAASARAEKLVPQTLRPVLQQLLDALGKVEAGDLAPQQASAMASLAGAIVRVFQAGTMEERLRALEEVQIHAAAGVRRGG